MIKIGFCQMTRLKDFEETKLCIERVGPNVDCTIIVYEQTLRNDNNSMSWLTDNKDKYHIVAVYNEWKDNFPDQRNVYLEKAKKLGIEWICSSDPDELYTIELATDLRKIIGHYDSMGYNRIGIACADQFENYEWLDDLDKIKECPGGYRKTDFYKPLLVMKLYTDLKYIGVGNTKNVHETVSLSERTKSINLPKEEKNGSFYGYIHKKDALKIWNNACLTPDSVIFTENGLKPISDVEEGEKVYTHKGRWKKIKKVLTREYSGEIIELRIIHGMPIRITTEHPILAVKTARCRYYDKFCHSNRKIITKDHISFDKRYNKYYNRHIVGCDTCVYKYYHNNYEQKWLKANDITDNCYMSFPIPLQEEYKLPSLVLHGNYDRWNDVRRPIKTIDMCEISRFLGWWLAEGSLDRNPDTANPAIEFSLGKDDTFIGSIIYIAQKYFDRKVQYQNWRKDGSIKLSFGCVDLAQYLLELFGKGAYNKKIPIELLGLPDNILRELIDGILDGDGTLNDIHASWETISPSIAQFIYLSLIKLGYVPTIFYDDEVYKDKADGDETSYKRKLTSEQKDEIKKRYWDGKKYGVKIDKKQLANAYGVSGTLIWKVLKGLSDDEYNIIGEKGERAEHTIERKHKQFRISVPKQVYFGGKENIKGYWLYEKGDVKNLSFQLSNISRYEYSGTVYNLEVEEDETYCAPGIILHNCRNMYISGGGDNVGDVNKLWVKLRLICNKLGITSWNEFEKFVELGTTKYYKEQEEKLKTQLYDENIDGITDLIFENAEKEVYIKLEDIKCNLQRFESWLISALQAGTNKWQTETRECAKWYYALHRDEIDDFILNFIEHPPKIDDNTELENFIDRTFFQELGHGVSIDNRLLFTEKIKSGKITREDLVITLRDSKEYKDKFPFGKLPDKVQNIKTDIDVTNVTEVEDFVEKCYQEILFRDMNDPDPAKKDYSLQIINRKLKPDKFVQILRSSEEYHDKHNDINDNDVKEIVKVSNSPFVSAKQEAQSRRRKVSVRDEILDLNSIDSSRYNTVGMCIMGHKDVIGNLIKSIEIMGPYVDEIHIQGNDFDGNCIEQFTDIGKKIGKDVNIHIVPWKEDFADYKNKTIGHSQTEWVAIFDDDEIPTKELAEKVKEIVLKSDRGNNFDLVVLDSVDIIVDKDGNEVHRSGLNRAKANLHWNVPNPYTGRVHIGLKQGYYPWKSIYAKGIEYEHWKTEEKILKCSTRNVVLGGGGDAVGEKNEVWTELWKVLKKLNINSWKEYYEYIQKGKIDNRLFEVMIKLDKKEWKDRELGDVLKFYLYLHPEENVR